MSTCGNKVTIPPISEFPQTIDRYSIVGLLGKGAMGKVYLAHDPLLEREVAIKVVAINSAARHGTADAYLSRFAAEAKALARLTHPSIVQIYDAGEDNGQPWIAFQLVEGESLETILLERRKLTLRRAMLFTIDIASALAHAHGWNIIHRDIKPGNILIEQRTRIAKLSDFGIAQAPWSRSVEDGTMVGSPGYMSPEQIDGKVVDQQSDLFSLGIVLYQMVSGEHPFLRETFVATINATCRGEYRPLTDLVPEIPKQLDAVIRRCLFVNVKMRMKTAAELVELLRPLAPEEPVLGIAAVYPSPGLVGCDGIFSGFLKRLRIMPLSHAVFNAIKTVYAKGPAGNELFHGEVIQPSRWRVKAGVQWGIRNAKKLLYAKTHA
jgi:eukaryotic-like serine/threonine-protein kinase